MSTEPSPSPDGNTAPAGDAATPTPDERPRRQRRRQQRTVLAVAMAVLLAGGGGAYRASTAGGDPQASGPGAGGDPPRLALDGFGKGGQSAGDSKSGGDVEGGAQPGIAPGEPTNARTFKAAPGALPEDGPDSAAVRRPVEQVSRAQVAKLAEALDVPGAPKKEKDRWTVGTPGKGDKPSLTVDTGAFAGNWTYDGAGSEPTTSKGEPVSESKAKDAAEPVLKALDLPGAKVSATTTMGGQRVVEAAPRIAGLPVHGWDSSFTVDPKGELVRGQGNLARTTKGAEYPLLSAKDTMQQLNKQRPQLKSGPQQDPVKVTKAELGLARHQSGGKPVLVPSWLYTVDMPGGAESPEPVSHPAVKPAYLKPAPGQGPMLPHPVKPDDPGEPESKPGEGAGPGTEPQHPDDPAKPGTGAETVKQDVTSYKSEGRTLKLSFWGGVCDKYTGTAQESADSVRVTVKAKNPDEKKVCVKMAKRQTVEVKLDKPLGDRKVIDTRNEQALPRS